MIVNTKKTKTVATLAMVMVSTLIGSVLYLAGCTSTLEGDKYDNQRPVVNFVNIPPDGQDFSANPVVYWYGSDNDGLIAYYRYHIAPRSTVGDMAPEDYVLTLSDEIFVTCDTSLCDTINQSGTPCDTLDPEANGLYFVCDSVSDWTYIYVDPAAADPHTANSLPLKADTTNPVTGFVEQYVFLQGYDTEGLGSKVVWRLFRRNDNPPETFALINQADLPFVNSERAGGIVTGIRLRWLAQDEIDYPTDPPPFEFQWRLYGPFTLAVDSLIDSLFVKDVFVTNDGFVYDVGDTIIRCDSLFTDSGLVETCDTVVVEPDMGSSVLGAMDVMFDVENPEFIASEYNVVADSSWNGIDTWVLNTSDTLYNVFKDLVTDSTIERQFKFWIRARDDAFVPDLVPDFETFPVINPKFERDVLLLDFTYRSGIFASKYTMSPNVLKPDSSLYNYPAEFHPVPFWTRLIRTWRQDLLFEHSDYYFVKNSKMKIGLNLKILLSYKLIIVYNEHIYPSDLREGKFSDPLWKAIDAGVNVWSTMRSPLEAPLFSGPEVEISPFNGKMPINYAFYFSVARTQFSAWFCKADAVFCNPKFRAEDFIGAHSIRPDRWPEVRIMPDLVENRMIWLGGIPFLPELPCVPEVNWSEAGLGSEVMYLYKSIYGADHPLGIDRFGFDWVMEGTPVGHRYNTGIFRTGHFDFTPLCMDTTWTRAGDSTSSSVQALVDTMLNFLYDPSIAAPVSEIRYHDAGQGLSISEMRRRYWERNDANFRRDNNGEDPWDLKRLKK